MSKMTLRRLRLGALLCLAYLGVSVAASPPARAAGDKEIVRQARQAYYTLRSEGLSAFQCNVAVDWDKLFTSILGPDGVANNPDLVNSGKATRFAAALGLDGQPKVTHRFGVVPADAKVKASLEQIVSGTEQVVGGSLQSWGGVLFATPFPAVESNYKLEERGSQYRLSFQEGKIDILIVMAKSLVISEMSVNMPEGLATLKPKFVKTPKGLLMSSYRGELERQGTKQHGQTGIEYQEVSGVKLPRKLSVDWSPSNSSISVKVDALFSDCKVTKG